VSRRTDDLVELGVDLYYFGGHLCGCWEEGKEGQVEPNLLEPDDPLGGCAGRICRTFILFFP
jgi:hypothetical protein